MVVQYYRMLTCKTAFTIFPTKGRCTVHLLRCSSAAPLRHGIPQPLAPKKPKAAGDTLSILLFEFENFVDYVRVRCKGGHGGNGACSFLRVWKNPYAGPDGGNGGNGAHVVFEADAQTKCLGHLKTFLKGRFGRDGKGENMAGKSEPAKIIKVPVGTQFTRIDTGDMWELNLEWQKFLAARGGAGGHGNAYYVNSQNTTPLTAEKGALGEEFSYEVQLRILANVGMVGFPNAGKSSLLRAVSRARPKVASYPFTTLKPVIGTVEYDDYQQISIADIPGVVEGSHKNYGLGLDFLRHIERCSCLVFVIDLTLTDPVTQMKELTSELRNYDPSLLSKPCVIVGNKVDLELSQKNVALLDELKMDGTQVMTVSTKTNEGITELLIHLRQLIDGEEEKRSLLKDENVYDNPRLIKPDIKMYRFTE